MSLSSEIHVALLGSPCQAFTSDLRVRVFSRMYGYPDLTIVCGEPIPADDHEDRSIESLQGYILVAQDQIRVEHARAVTAHTWTHRDYQTASEPLQIESVGVSIPLVQI